MSCLVSKRPTTKSSYFRVATQSKPTVVGFCFFFTDLFVLAVSGGYDVVDMAVLGATLGVLLFICLVVIGLLICRMQKGKADWRKIYETNVFRSSVSLLSTVCKTPG